MLDSCKDVIVYGVMKVVYVKIENKICDYEIRYEVK